MAVQVFKVIREKLGFTRYKMAQELGIRQSQYDYLENTARSVSSKTLVKLRKLAQEAGISGNQLWDLIEKKLD